MKLLIINLVSGDTRNNQEDCQIKESLDKIQRQIEKVDNNTQEMKKYIDNKFEVMGSKFKEVEKYLKFLTVMEASNFWIMEHRYKKLLDKETIESLNFDSPKELFRDDIMNKALNNLDRSRIFIR